MSKKAAPLMSNYIIVGECWIWKNSLDRNGYPQITRSGRTYRAHCFYFENLKRVRLTPGLQLDHTCKNILCVNPNHMEEVTQKINLERAGMLKVSDADVLAIRDLYWNKNIKQKQLSIQYNVTQQQISRIVNKVDRKDV